MKKFILIIIFLAIFVNILEATKGWESSQLLSQNTGENKYPDIYSYKNYYSAVWINLKKNNTDILFTTSTNYGRDWLSPKTVTSLNTYKLAKPTTIIYKNYIIIGISDENNNIAIYFKKLQDITFNKFTIISNNKINLLPHFKIFNNNLYLFYQENISNDRFAIKSSHILNTITNWSAPENVIEYKQSAIGTFFPKLKQFNNRLYIIWSDRLGKENFRNDIIYIKEFNKDNQKRVALTDNNENSLFPDLIMDNSGVKITYFSKRMSESDFIFTLKNRIFNFIDNQLKPIKTKNLNFQFSEYYQTTLLTHKDKFYLLWYSYKNKKADLFYSTSDDFTNWTEPIQITTEGIKNWNFKTTTNNNKIVMIYEKDFKNKSLIYLRESDEKCLPPVVSSTTHKSNIWSYSDSVTFQWKTPEDPSGIQGFSYALDNYPNTEPDIENMSAEINGRTFNQIGNGIFYFHIRAIDGNNNWSDTAHYKIMVNTSPPDAPIISSPTHQEIIPSNNHSPTFVWKMKDNRPIKGYSYLFTPEKNMEPADKINIKKEKIQFDNIKSGMWYFMVKACDPQNRWSDYSTYTITVEDIIVATGFSEEATSRYFHKIKKGDVLYNIMANVLQLSNKSTEPREYEKPVDDFNYLQNPDFIRPGDTIMFPIILASPGDTKEGIAQKYFGNAKLHENIVIVNKKGDYIEPGDKIIIKDKYFLRTGKTKSEQTSVYSKTNIMK